MDLKPVLTITSKWLACPVKTFVKAHSANAFKASLSFNLVATPNVIDARSSCICGSLQGNNLFNNNSNSCGCFIAQAVSAVRRRSRNEWSRDASAQPKISGFYYAKIIPIGKVHLRHVDQLPYEDHKGDIGGSLLFQVHGYPDYPFPARFYRDQLLLVAS